MATVNTLVRSLKKALKQNAMTYAMVGKGLGLSEASIKRMFAAKHFSLKRLEQICAMVPAARFRQLALHSACLRARGASNM
ncbi:MAG: hypothetical protein ACREYF_13520 [Gammaproteobacteria bacterium]